MFNLKQTNMNMNVKSLMLLLAFAGLGASCTDDVEGGGGSGIAGRTELQIAFSGNGESQEYTKAAASESENEIKDLKIYLFAASAENGEYQYLETWEEGQAYNPDQADVTKFKKQTSGTSVKASIYPNEKVGLPWIKLYCVANNGSHQTTDGKYYEEDGTTEILDELKAVETGTDGTITTPGTKEADFIKSFTKEIGTDETTGILGTPLLMTGNGKTKISGSVSKVDIIMRRLVARFDIDNAASKTNLTITSLTMAHARKTAPLWGAAPTKVEEGDLANDPKLTTYKDVAFDEITGANVGLTESAFYTYPSLATDQSYLIIKGTYKSPITSQQVPVTYNIPIVRTPDGADKGEYIAINANNRYTLRISDVTQSNVFASFEVVDWTSGGGIIVKPDNDAPVLDKAVAFSGNNAPKELTDLATEVAPYNYEVTGTEGAGDFDVTIAATGKVRAEKGAVTKTEDPTSWLTIGTPTYEEKEGVWYTKFNIAYTNAIGQQPVAVTFINESASYDPALWTTINLYGPKAVPSFAVVAKDGASKGNETNADDAKAPTAKIYSVNNSFVLFDITSIEGVETEGLTGYKAEKVKTEGFVHTYKISVSDEAAAAGGEMIFKNAGDDTKTTTLTITKADPSLKFVEVTDADNVGDYVEGSETPYVTTGTLKIDLDALNSYTFKIEAPVGLNVNSTTSSWLTITEDHAWADSENNRYVQYTLNKKDSPSATSDFHLIFTNAITGSNINAPNLDITVHKDYSKPKLSAGTSTEQWSKYNTDFSVDASFDNPTAATISMYKFNNSTITVTMNCTEAASFEAVTGLTIAQIGVTDEYTIKVTDAASLSDNSEIFAHNNGAYGSDPSTDRKAKLTITWVSPDITVEALATGAATPTVSGLNIEVPSDFKRYTDASFKILGCKGSTLTYSDATGKWCTFDVAPISINGSGAAVVTILGTSDVSDTTPMTITVHNAVKDQNETITITKAVAP